MEQAKCYVIDTRMIGKDIARKLSSQGTIVKAAGLTFVLLTALPDVSFAAGTGIDVGAEKIYKKLLNVGKWVIIVKGGMDTIKSVADGDLPSAKKNFLGYVVTYAILWALPWALGEVDKLFENTDTAG
jgi:hypothetical protein